MKMYDESLYCQECGKRITVQNSLFGDDCCDDCYKIIHMKKYEVTFKAQGTRHTVAICISLDDTRNRFTSLTDEQFISVGLHFYVGTLVRIVSIKQI